MTSGQITYDLRRLRIRGLIQRIPRSFRYQVTDAGLRQALFLTRLVNRMMLPGLAQLTDSSPARILTAAGGRPCLRDRHRRPREEQDH